MYKKFYGLTRNPFELSPDPYFLYPTARHNEALACLYYGVRRHKGFVVLAGEVGTGKTLLIRCLLNLLNHNQVAFAYVFNTRLSVTQFFQYILGDFGLSPGGKSKSEMLLELNNFLIDRHRRGLTTVLVVDEAQQLRRDLLEEIRLLTNLETSQQKLLQIILAGQPELDRKLDAPELRQLKQRIAHRAWLEPLTEAETQGYILRRLELAGARGRARDLFPEAAVKVVHTHSRGIPRLINTLCENGLIAAYARQARNVDPEIIEEIAADFRLQPEQTAAAAADNGQTQNRKAVLKMLLQMLESLEGGREVKPAPIDTVSAGGSHTS